MQENTGSRQQKTADKSNPSKSYAKCTKRKADSMCEEAYTVMKQLTNKVNKRDESDVFGEHVANSLRNIKSTSIQSQIKYEINGALYRGETKYHNEQTSYNTPGSSTLSDTSAHFSFDTTPVPSNQSWNTEKNDENDFNFENALTNVNI